MYVQILHNTKQWQVNMQYGLEHNDGQYFQGSSRRFWNETCHGVFPPSDELET